MTQARDTLSLRLQLIPMQLPEAWPQAARGDVRPGDQFDRRRSPLAGSLASTSGSSGCQLVLYPGEASEILVRLDNLGNSPLEIDLQVAGNFPSAWCRIGSEGRRLAPGSRMEAVLYFQLAADFFEAQDALGPAEFLILDYQGQLIVHYAQSDPSQDSDQPPALPYRDAANFDLHVRPRSLYRNFVPELYREVDFIGRLLKIFEQTFEPAVQTLDTLWAYLDPLMAPRALLPFLAHWVGWPLMPGIPVNRQRQLIQQAMTLYRWRGTRRGLRLYLHLYTDLPLDDDRSEAEKHICIQEVLGPGFVVGAAQLGQDTLIGGGQPYHFIVYLRPDTPEQLDSNLIHQIIAQEKPAFCTYDLYIE